MWYRDERLGERRQERYCPNNDCGVFGETVFDQDHCFDCGFYYMPGTWSDSEAILFRLIEEMN